jgi:hypothetical protein
MNDLGQAANEKLTDVSPPQELWTDGLGVATHVREARRQLVDRPGGQGNSNAMTIGHCSEQMQTALAPVRDAIERAVLADLGFAKDGSEQPAEALRITARNLASLDVLAETFWTWLEGRGVLTSKGKTRSAVNTLLSIIDRQTKLAAVVGLTRRTKDIRAMSVQQWLDHERQQTNGR